MWIEKILIMYDMHTIRLLNQETEKNDKRTKIDLMIFMGQFSFILLLYVIGWIRWRYACMFIWEAHLMRWAMFCVMENIDVHHTNVLRSNNFSVFLQFVYQTNPCQTTVAYVACLFQCGIECMDMAKFNPWYHCLIQWTRVTVIPW